MNINQTQAKHPKYRPSLSEQEIHDCINALKSNNPTSSALKTLQIFAYKMQFGEVVPTNNNVQSVKSLTKDMPTDEELKEIEAEFMAKLKKDFPIKDVKISDL